MESVDRALATMEPSTPPPLALPGWFHRIGDRLWEHWEALRLRSLLWIVNGVVVGVLAFMLFPMVLGPTFSREADIHTAIDPHFALLLLCACAAPSLLARLCYSLINKKASSQQVCLDFSRALDSELARRAVSSWLYEIRRNQGSLSRAESFAGLWGVMTTLVLVGAVTFLLPPFHQPLGTPFSQPHNMVAFAVVGAASTRFLLDLARICIRVSNDDASKRMFAETLRALILSVIATLAFTLIFGLADPRPSGGASGLIGVLQSTGIGAGIAMVGVPAFEYVVRKVSGSLGIAPPVQPTMTPLAVLVGITAAEIDRLGEEGIDSVECLVSTPLPRIFLNTRFSLQRICDWFDKGLLLCRIGAAATAELRGRSGLTGALELKQIVGEGNDQRASAIVTAIRKAMRIENEDEARLLVGAVVSDDAVAMLETLRRTPLADPSAIEGATAPFAAGAATVDAGPAAQCRIVS